MAIQFQNPKEYIGELIGTMLLIGFGCFIGGCTVFNNVRWDVLGNAVVSPGMSMITAIVFALVFVALVYCIGGICNCHFNPLISLSMMITGKMDAKDTLWYVLAQIIGGILGALFAFYMLTQYMYTDDVLVYPSVFGKSSFDGNLEAIDWVGAIVVEFVFAFVLCFVAMKATESKKIDMKAGAIIAVAMFGLIYVGSGLTATAVNPAKSIGAAIAMMFSGIKGSFDPLIQLWMFIIVPLLGAIVGTIIYMITNNDEFDVNEYINKVKEKQAAKKAAKEEAKAAAEAEAAEAAEAEEVSEEEVAADEPAEEEPAEEAEDPSDDSIPEIESIEEEKE